MLTERLQRFKLNGFLKHPWWTILILRFGGLTEVTMTYELFLQVEFMVINTDT